MSSSLQTIAFLYTGKSPASGRDASDKTVVEHWVETPNGAAGQVYTPQPLHHRQPPAPSVAAYDQQGGTSDQFYPWFLQGSGGRDMENTVRAYDIWGSTCILNLFYPRKSILVQRKVSNTKLFRL